MRHLLWIGLLALLGASCSVRVTVDRPPIAHAGFDQVVVVGDTVLLDGARSRNKRGDGLDGLGYAWTMVATPERSAAALDDPAAAAPSFVADRPGAYIVRLVVTDGGDASAPDLVNVLARPVLEVAWSAPVDGADEVPVASPMVVAFSAPLQSRTVTRDTISLATAAGAPVDCGLALEDGNRVVVLQPSAPLAAGAAFRLYVSQGVLDGFGISLAAPVSIAFTTAAAADATPPAIVQVSPADGVAAPPGTTVEVVFSEPVAAATLDTTSFAVRAGATPVPGALELVAGVFARFSPDAPFTAGAAIDVTVDDTITDVAGNALDGDGDGAAGGARAWSFAISSAPDTTPPTVISVLPGDGALDVSLGSRVRVELSEAVLPATVTPLTVLLEDAEGAPVPSTVSLAPNRRALTVVPDTLLAPNVRFTVTLSDAITDLGGLGLDGDGDGVAGGVFVSSFTTLDVSGETGLLGVAATLRPGVRYDVTLTDTNLDVSGNADRVTILVTSDAGEAEAVTLVETGLESGVFAGSLTTSFQEVVPGTDDDGALNLQAGLTITATYDDLLNDDGVAETVTATTLVTGGVDGTVEVVNAGENRLTITVRDSDAVANPTAGTDVLACAGLSPCVRVSTPSTGDSEDLALLVEGQEGIFAASLDTAVAAFATPNNGVLEIAGAATVEARYSDALRANGDSRGFVVLGSTAISLAYVLVRDQPGGAGAEVGNLTVSTDNAVLFYAAGYDDQDGYLGDQSVTWTVSGGIGAVDPGSGSSTTFDARRVGFGIITATHPDVAVSPDSTGGINVVAGALRYVIVRDASDGGGNPVGDLTRTADQTASLYCAGYDGDDNFVGNTVATWSVTGAIGTVNPTVGANTLFDATTVGVGRVTATPGGTGVTADSTGNITVSGGALSRIIIYDATGGPTGGGNPVDNLPLDTDGSVTLYAAAFDADGNYLGDQSVNWTVTGGIGDLSQATGSSTTFDPTTVGSGQIQAIHGGGASDATGVISVTAGALSIIRIRSAGAGGGTLVGPATLTTDQNQPVYAAGYDANGNFVGDQAVTWSVVGGIGAVAPVGPSTSAVFNPTTVGTGTVRATFAAVDYPSGLLTVTVGALAAVRVRDQGGCIGGADLGAVTRSADQTLNVFAVGYDADGNCRGDVSVDWSVSGGIGVMTVPTGSSSAFDAQTVGSGTITASHGTAGSDDTGTITVTVGALAAVQIRSAPLGGGSEVGGVTITVADTLTLYVAGYDADGNYHSDPTATWSVLGGAGSVAPASGSSTIFTPSSSSPGETVRAVVGGTIQDDAGPIEITTSLANLDYVKIMTAAGCSGTDPIGSEVGAVSISTDGTLTLFAVGFDNVNQCLGNVSVTWVLNGAGGVLNPGPTTSTVFDPRVAGATPTISADHPTATDDTTGTITISAGVLRTIRVRDASGGGGAVVGNLSLTTDQSRTFYAAGYDADNNYLGDQSVTWSVTGGIGLVSPGSGSSTAFDPRAIGSGTVVADHATPTVTDGATGTITVAVGALASVRVRDAAGGAGGEVGALSLTTDETLPLFAAGYDADGNFIADQDVTWSVTGGIGSIPPGPSSTAVLDPSSVGSGTVTATHPTAGIDSTGTLTVTVGALAGVRIRSAAGGGGAEVGDLTISTDDSLTAYAAGYDADGNYRGDESVTWSVAGGVGAAAPASGVSTVFDPTTIGVGSILADHPTAGVTDDATGVITVIGGDLSEVRIRSASDGAGNEIGDLSLTADDQVALYAAGYDADDNYLGDQSVTWSVTGAIGAFAPNPGPSTIFYANLVGSGVITADHATVTDDTSGTITVTAGAIYSITVRDAASNGGAPVGALSLTTDDTRTFYAAGYDRDANYIGDVSVTWVVSGGIGGVVPGTGSSTVFDATVVGSGTVTANHPTAQDDSTGLVTVGVGALSYVRVRSGANNTGIEVGDATIPVDETRTYYAAGYDADGNFRSDQSVSWTLTILTGPLSGSRSPATGTSTTFDPDAEGTAQLTADHASATDDSTGTLTVVAANAPVVTGVAPPSAHRNRTGVALTVSGTNFDCSGAGPTVTFLPAGNVAVTARTSCSATEIAITVDIPCGAPAGSYDVLVTNPDGRFGIGAALFAATTETEGPFGSAACSDTRDNDCDGSTDAADPGCAAPTRIGVSCASPVAESGPSACTVDLDGVAGQVSYLTCTATQVITTLFSDPFNDMSQWPTTVAGSPATECTYLPTGCAAYANNGAWTAERRVDTRGMDRVCLDFRIAKSAADAGDGVTLSFNAGSGWTTAFNLDFGSWHTDDLRHDAQGTAAADYYKNVCLTDISAAAGNNANLGLRLNLRSSAWGDRVFVDEMVMTGMSGTTTNLFCDGMTNLSAWTVASGTVSVSSGLGGNNAAYATAAATMYRCFDASSYDVVDLTFNPAQDNEGAANHLYADLGVAGGSGSFSQMVDIWYDARTNVDGTWNRDYRLLDFYKLFRLSDFDPGAARNATTCVRFRFASAGDDIWVDDVCVDGFTYQAGVLSVGALSDAGGGSYTFDLDASRAVTGEVSCTWSRGSLTLTTDCVGSNSCPATVRFTP